METNYIEYSDRFGYIIGTIPGVQLLKYIASQHNIKLLNITEERGWVRTTLYFTLGGDVDDIKNAMFHLCNILKK
jgi:hypothetical protein